MNKIHDPERVTYIGTTNGRGESKTFGIKAKDRSRHIYVVGKTGVGKSTLLETLAIQDFKNQEGLIFMDPHGPSADLLLDFIPEYRLKDAIYFNPSDADYPIGLNIMEDVGYTKRHLVASSLLSSFKKIWGEASWSDRMAHILNNTILALLEYPDTTLLDINRMYANPEFRKKVVASLKDPQIKTFWYSEFDRYSERYAADATPAIQNKIGQFTSNPIMRNIIGQSKSSFNFREIMDSGKILIVNLSKGLIGDGNAAMLGVLLSTKIYLAALTRAELSPKELSEIPACNFFVDEFQSFASETFASILSEARKYKLNLVLAHQYITQMPEEVRDAVFGNVGTIITFRVGPLDAEFLERVFAPVFQADDFVNLELRQIYLSAMVDGTGTPGFSATTLEKYPDPKESLRDQVIKNTRDRYAVPAEEIEVRVSAMVEKDIEEMTKKSLSKQQSGNKKFQGTNYNNKNQNGKYQNDRNQDNRNQNGKYQNDRNQDNRNQSGKYQNDRNQDNRNQNGRDQNGRNQDNRYQNRGDKDGKNQNNGELGDFLKKMKAGEYVEDKKENKNTSKGGDEEWGTLGDVSIPKDGNNKNNE